MPYGARFLLWPFSLIYRFVVFLWDIYWRVAPKVKLESKVVSVGNITAGGTGKTPLVIHIAVLAAAAGLRTAVVARGYRRIGKGLAKVTKNSSWQDVGDEPLEIFRRTQNVMVYVADSKTSAARRAASEGAEVIIIDDGFQHRKLHRDIDIVCLDRSSPRGPGGYLPMGLLRESVSSLKRADIVVYTSTDQQDEPGQPPPIPVGNAQIFASSFSIVGFSRLGASDNIGIDDVISKRSIAFCGLGSPQKFKDCLENINIKPLQFICYKDHHRYTQKDIARLADLASNLGADCLLTTHKDAVKIEGFDFGNIDIYYAMLKIGIDRLADFRRALGI